MNKARTDGGSTACYNGHTGVVKALLACDEIDANSARTDNGATPLYIACNQDNTGIIRILLADRRVDANNAITHDYGAQTPLHATAITNRYVGCSRYKLISMTKR